MPYKDPEKQRESQRRWYEASKGKMIARSTQWKRDQRSKIKQMVKEAKSQPCADCGVSYPTYVMDFDHVRGIKDCNISAMIQRAVSVEVVQQEMDKCEVVCSNCHRERTWGPSGD